MSVYTDVIEALMDLVGTKVHVIAGSPDQEAPMVVAMLGTLTRPEPDDLTKLSIGQDVTVFLLANAEGEVDQGHGLYIPREAFRGGRVDDGDVTVDIGPFRILVQRA